MILIYTHENNIIVENARNLLRENGISSTLKNQFTGSGLGELPAFVTWPEVWVEERDYSQAKAIIDELLKPIEGKRWICEACKEVNEPTFQLCWNCQTEKLE